MNFFDAASHTVEITPAQFSQFMSSIFGNDVIHEDDFSQIFLTVYDSLCEKPANADDVKTEQEMKDEISKMVRKRIR